MIALFHDNDNIFKSNILINRHEIGNHPENQLGGIMSALMCGY
jgi:hypothetical protein